MSELLVPTARIENVTPHPNADRLAIAEILGWQVVVGKDTEHYVGELVTYVPPDTLVPEQLSQDWGVAQYLSKGRVRAIKLRGEPSFGFIAPYVPGTQPGDNVASHFGITKYEPPPPKEFRGGFDGGQRVGMKNSHPLLWKYTDIDNYRHYPDLFEFDEIVSMTEKIHGTNVRIARVTDDDGVSIVAGSMNWQREMPEDLRANPYWLPYSIPSVKNFLDNGFPQNKQVVVYGETFGGPIQSTMRYGRTETDFRVFDVMVDGKFLSWFDLIYAANVFELPLVPIVYVGAFAKERVIHFGNGPSLIDGADHIREGVVIKPVVERTHPKIGRVILKYVNDDYLTGNYNDQSHDPGEVPWWNDPAVGGNRTHARDKDIG